MRSKSSPLGREPRPRRLGGLLLAAVVAAAVVGCGDISGSGGRKIVVTTIAPIRSLTEQVAGGLLTVRSVIPDGQNGHTYQARPSDARALADADLFLDNGLGLNQSVSNLAAVNLPKRARMVFLGEHSSLMAVLIVESGSAASCHEGHCHGGTGDVPNAHLWPDPRYALIYVDQIEQALAKLQPNDARKFAANADRVRAEINALHESIVQATATIPSANRKMVVYHDAWSYFARRYGLRVIGALQPSDFSEPSVAEVTRMIEQIKAERVPAFFGSEVFPSDVLDAIAEETKTTYVKEISDDRLPGDRDDANHSYVGMMRENARRIVTALGGNASALSAQLPLSSPTA